MDIARPSNARQKRIRRIAYGAIGAARRRADHARPVAPEAGGARRRARDVWLDTVKRGPMLRQVRGLGTLVPEDIRWIPATTQGRVERILLRPGTRGDGRTASSSSSSNPQLEQELQDAELKVQAAEAALANLRVQLAERLPAAAGGGGQHRGRLQQGAHAGRDERGARRRDSSSRRSSLRQSKLDAEQLARPRRDRPGAARELRRVDAARSSPCSSREVDQARAMLQLKQRQRDELKVRAGLDGVLQLVPVEVGQQVAPGTNLARVANPARLKAEIKIAETQAKDIQIGQTATIDTRNGIVDGTRHAHRSVGAERHASRSTSRSTASCRAARVPDLSVDGTIELERLDDVLYVGPAGVRPGTERGRPVQARRRRRARRACR